MKNFIKVLTLSLSLTACMKAENEKQAAASPSVDGVYQSNGETVVVSHLGSDGLKIERGDKVYVLRKTSKPGSLSEMYENDSPPYVLATLMTNRPGNPTQEHPHGEPIHMLRVKFYGKGSPVRAVYVRTNASPTVAAK